MSFKVEQRIGNNIYIYEVQSYWDSEKKQARQKRIYLGKKDPVTGKTIPAKPKMRPKLVLDFGNIYFLESIFKQSGLASILSNIFPDSFEKIKQVCFFQLNEKRPLSLFGNWIDTVKINNKQIMSSQRISDFTIKLGDNDIDRDMFFQEWVFSNKSKRHLFYDITSFSSYSKSLEFIEWGYNRDKEKLPQLNYGMILNASNLLPLFYEIYPGSITDVTTIRNVLKRAKKYKIKDITFVLDKGFYSQKNLKSIIEENLNFVIPMPFSGSIARKIIEDESFKTASNLFHFKNGRSFFHKQVSIEIAGHNLYANLYFNEKIRARDIDNFAKIAGNIEDNFNKENYKNKDDFDEYFSGSYEQYKKYFKAEKQEKFYKIYKVDSVINKLFHQFGKIILLTRTKNEDRSKLIEIYTNKDEIEKDFDVFKNDLGHKRLRSSNNSSMQGRMFLNYLTLIMHNYISSKMKKNKLVDKYSITELFLELKKLKTVEMKNEKFYINEITKKQKDIFKLFDISLPSET